MDSNSFLFTLSSIASSMGYMMRDPGFSWTRALPYLLPMLIPLLSYARTEALSDMWSRVWNGCRRRNVMEFTARLRLRNWAQEPDSIVRNFSVVLWEWNRKNLTVNCKSLTEEGVSINYYRDDEHEDKHRRSCPLFVDDPVHEFWNKNTPGIKYLMWTQQNTDREGISHPEIILRMSFHDHGHTPNSIVQHIETIKKEAERIHAERSRKQRVLVSTEKTSTNDNYSGMSGGPNFMTYEFATTSSFQNFFSEEASGVNADLDYFLNNRSAYERTGRPWTYTVLNEGPPGVGKTKLVKAIAAKTGHTLIIINLAHISSIETLYEAFHSPILAGEYVSHEKRLYYIPEVDTQMFEILKSRDGKTTATATATATATVTDAQNSQDATKFKKSGFDALTAAGKKPTLGEILNILDGVPERYGHILILDTNHLSGLDPALIRPGRVDRIVSWKKMSAASTRAYIENYYQIILPKTVVFADSMFTAAELQSHVSRSKDWETLLPSLLLGASQKLNVRRSQRGYRKPQIQI